MRSNIFGNTFKFIHNFKTLLSSVRYINILRYYKSFVPTHAFFKDINFAYMITYQYNAQSVFKSIRIIFLIHNHKSQFIKLNMNKAAICKAFAINSINKIYNIFLFMDFFYFWELLPTIYLKKIWILFCFDCVICTVLLVKIIQNNFSSYGIIYFIRRASKYEKKNRGYFLLLAIHITYSVLVNYSKYAKIKTFISGHNPYILT